MAAGQGTPVLRKETEDESIRWKFDADEFWEHYNVFGDNPDLLMNQIRNVLGMIPSKWRGRADIEEVPNGIKLLTGPNQSSLVSVTVTTDAEKNYSYVPGPTTGNYIPDSLRGKRSPWDRDDVERALMEIFDEYVVEDEEETAKQRMRDTAKQRMRDVRGLTEASKSGLPVPTEVQAHIASFLTGEKGTMKKQTETLKQKASGQSRRKKTKRSAKKRLTRRR